MKKKIDPTSDRYRICKYDEVPFMAHHRSMLFCNQHCADEFHNREKKNLKLEMETKLRDFRTRMVRDFRTRMDIDGENVAFLKIQIADLKKGIDYWQKESHHWYKQAIEMADLYNQVTK